MIPIFLIEKIRQRAYEIYQYRMENQMFFTIDNAGNEKPITAEDDWLEAEGEVKCNTLDGVIAEEESLLRNK